MEGEMMTGFKPLTVTQARACGMGEGAACCVFLMAGATGFECAQRSELADTLFKRAKAGQMHAQRTPEQDFPACQQEGR
jgi:hypothetical protein